MSEKKPIYLLAGGHWNNPAAMLPLMRKILADTGKSRPRIASIGTANGDSSMFYHFTAGLFRKAGAETKKVILAKAKANLNQARDLLEASDAVFISGGDVDAGMRWLELHRMKDFLKRLYDNGTLFFGISAGSIMLGSRWVRWEDPDNDDSAELFDCLGLAPLICDTHAEGDDWVELKTAVKLAGKDACGYGIPTSGVIRVAPDGTLTGIENEVVVYRNDDGKAEEAGVLSAFGIQ